MSYINVIILVITILIAPYVGLLVSATMNRSFSPIFLYFWYWIPVCAILVFQLTAPAAILGLVIVHFYLEKRKLPFLKSKWIIHACIFGFCPWGACRLDGFFLLLEGLSQRHKRILADGYCHRLYDGSFSSITHLQEYPSSHTEEGIHKS